MFTGYDYVSHISYITPCGEHSPLAEIHANIAVCLTRRTSSSTPFIRRASEKQRARQNGSPRPDSLQKSTLNARVCIAVHACLRFIFILLLLTEPRASLTHTHSVSKRAARSYLRMRQRRPWLQQTPVPQRVAGGLTLTAGSSAARRVPPEHAIGRDAVTHGKKRREDADWLIQLSASNTSVLVTKIHMISLSLSISL